MTTTLIPGADLVPSMTSRVVTIDVVDMLEGAPGDGWVDFTLPCDLHVPADNRIIRAGSVRVHLLDGQGTVRLPCYDADAQTVEQGHDWAILVKKSWEKRGSYAIRVPESVAPISLADLPAVRPLSPRERLYAVTGASVTVTEGGSWDASADLDNGIIRLGLTVPPGGTAWYRGLAADGIDLDALDAPGDSGIYRLRPSGGYLNLPPGIEGNEALVSVESSGNSGEQTVTAYQSPRLWRRRIVNYLTRPRGWSEWTRGDLDVEEVEDALQGIFNRKGTVPDGTDLDTWTGMSRNGIHILTSTHEYVNAPPYPSTRVNAMLANFSSGSGDTWQRVVFRAGGGVYDRYETAGGRFTDWGPVGGNGGPVDPEVGARVDALSHAVTPRTQFEATSRFSELPNAQTLTKWIAEAYPRRVELLELGASRDGHPLRGLRLGDPANPAIYYMASSHGDEPMGKEAALTFARELAESPDYETLIADVCVVIMPYVNADTMNVSRLSSNMTDLNRAWGTRTREEVQAAASVFDEHNVLLFLDCHEGGAVDKFLTVEPEAPGIAQELKDQAHKLRNHLHALMADSPYPGGDYIAPFEEGKARDSVSLNEKAVAFSYESPSMLHTNMYFPNVNTRHTNYVNVMWWTLEHFIENLPDYEAAVAAARQ